MADGGKPADGVAWLVQMARTATDLRLLFSVLAVSFWVLQVVEHAKFEEMAENNHQRTLALRAPRGILYDPRWPWHAAAALGRIGLASAVRAGLDPCAALQVSLSLGPGEIARSSCVIRALSRP